MELTTKSGRVIEYNLYSDKRCNELAYYFIEEYFDDWEPIVNEFPTKDTRFEFLNTIGVGVRSNTKKAEIAIKSISHHSIPKIIEYLNIDDDIIQDKIKLAEAEYKKWFNDAYASYRKKR